MCVAMRTIILVLSLLMAACSHKPYAVQRNDIQKQPVHETYIHHHGWHTAWLIPAHDLQSHIPALKKRFPNTAYISIGWGDETVYQADETTFWASTYAIILPTNPVLHIVSLSQSPQQTYPKQELALLCLADSAYQTLLTYISHSFERDSQGDIIPTAIDDGANSQFYRSVGDYYFLNTCNTWTAKGLASAGFDIYPLFNPTSGNVWRYLQGAMPQQVNKCPSKPH